MIPRLVPEGGYRTLSMTEKEEEEQEEEEKEKDWFWNILEVGCIHLGSCFTFFFV